MSTKICFFLFFTIFLFYSKPAKCQSAYNAEIKQTAISLFNSFDKMQKLPAELDFKDTARMKWNNLPVGLRARAGLNIGKMTDEQRKLLHRVLSASLSSQGY